MSLLSDMGPSIFAATIAAAASAMVGIALNGDGVVARVGHGNETLGLACRRRSYRPIVLQSFASVGNRFYIL